MSNLEFNKMRLRVIGRYFKHGQGQKGVRVARLFPERHSNEPASSFMWWEMVR